MSRQFLSGQYINCDLYDKSVYFAIDGNLSYSTTDTTTLNGGYHTVTYPSDKGFLPLQQLDYIHVQTTDHYYSPTNQMTIYLNSNSQVKGYLLGGIAEYK